MAKNTKTTDEVEAESDFFLPTYGLTVRATSVEDAVAKAESLSKKSINE